ncbi:unnamed protein product [Ceratitis capitata]|uniref:(Mediterranean fruit fly) hypothetical protein n=1 Tax=Ceratitis capitata TaxID=7213 RepID=A0A811UIV2_CERCA|nr:unnamed protein product [Ceratitis capitata]
MVSPLQKRLFILLIMSFLLLFIIRYLFFHGDIVAAIKASTEEYKRTANMPVLVTVYYEALCGDSKHFIIKQLLPAFKQASPIMDVQLVPYGKAKTSTTLTGSYRFECQHGQTECEANMYHACAIEAIQRAEDRINMVACMIHDNRRPREALHNVSTTCSISFRHYFQNNGSI